MKDTADHVMDKYLMPNSDELLARLVVQEKQRRESLFTEGFLQGYKYRTYASNGSEWCGLESDEDLRTVALEYFREVRV
jgi:hypothetical protein